MSDDRVKILDIPFDSLTEYEALAKISARFYGTGKKPFFIATPNPEMLLEASKNSIFKKILQNTDLNIPDGIGILWAAKYLSDINDTKSKTIKIIKGLLSLILIIFKPSSIKKILPERVTGTDMMQKINQNLGKDVKIFLLGGEPGVAEKTGKILKDKYGIFVAGTNDGSADASNDKNLIHAINRTGADILFVAFGAPKQELWLNRNLTFLKTVKIAVGVGGAFDFISGNTKRAPEIMRKMGLEWLYRLFHQPHRIKRIFNATIIFPLTVIKSSLK